MVSLMTMVAAAVIAVAQPKAEPTPAATPAVAPSADKEPKKPATGPKGFEYQNDADNLVLVFKKLREAVLAKDWATAAGFARDLRPTLERARKAFRDDLSKEDLDKVKAFYETMPKDKGDESVARQFNSSEGQDHIIFHKASTEVLKKGHPEFAGGARSVAEKYLKPGMDFYVVRYVVKGESIGTAYHFVFWDGEKWCMLGPLWRAERAAAPAAAPEKKPS